MQKLTEDDDSESLSGEYEDRSDSGDDCMGDESIKRKLDDLIKFPFEIGDLQVIRLGNCLWSALTKKRKKFSISLLAPSFT